MKGGECMAGGRALKLFSKEEFLNLCLEYFDFIYTNQEDKETIAEPPTFYGLYRFVKDRKECSYHTIRRCFDEYWADIKKDFEKMRADLLVRGSALGRYNSTISIFALKNWCKWTDKQDVTLDDKRDGQLASLIEGLKEDDLYTETETPNEAMANEPTETN